MTTPTLQPPLSRTKILAYLKANYVDQSSMDIGNLYLYSAGNNIRVNHMIVSIINGEFDEVGE